MTTEQDFPTEAKDTESMPTTETVEVTDNADSDEDSAGQDED